MPTYSDLISDLADENNGILPDNIAYLIREVERELWQELYIYAPETLYTVTATAGSSSVPLTNTEKWLHVRSVTTQTGALLRRVSFQIFDLLDKQASTPELYAYSWNPSSSTLNITKPPSVDTTLTVTVMEREDFIQDGDPDSSKFFLAEGYNVLKYAVLYKRINNPDLKEEWRSRFMEAYRSAVIALKSRKRIPVIGISPVIIPTEAQGQEGQ